MARVCDIFDDCPVAELLNGKGLKVLVDFGLFSHNVDGWLMFAVTCIAKEVPVRRTVIWG